jgi:hypothetical protein
MNKEDRRKIVEERTKNIEYRISVAQEKSLKSF